MVKRKLFKGLLTLSICASTLAFIGGEADAAYQNYASTGFTYGVFVGGGYGTIFDLVGKQHFEATQAPKYEGQPCGIKYQIRLSSDTGTGTPSKSVSVTGAKSNYNVNVDGPTGQKKAYLRNYYSTDYSQVASGKFVY